MNIRALELVHFMGHKRTRLELPRTGVVLIVGENGAGKSSIVEAASWAGWGKTLRGDLPWWEDAQEPCEAVLEDDDDLVITRTRRGKSNGLSFSSGPEAPTKFDTPSKAQEALTELTGSYDLWRRSHVFSSADATHFTLATDGDRKRLIESFLGNNVFDPAVERCRADLKVATTKVNQLTRAVEVLTAKLESEERRLNENVASLAAVKVPPAPVQTKAGKPLSTWDADIKKAKDGVYDIERRIREADRAGASHDAEVRSAKVFLDRLRADTCPTCAQPITAAMRATEHKKADKLAHKAIEAREAAKAELGDAETVLADLRAELEHLQAARNERATEMRLESQAMQEADRIASQKRVIEQTIANAKATITKSKSDLVDYEDDLDGVTADMAELTEVEKVLGLKGVRSNILGNSLAGIEAVANAWLARLRQGVTLELKPYSEKGPADAISLTTRGLGRGTYKSTSGGERRRVDVSLLLGLGEVANAARGQTAGTLWFDEVFDCLDDAGVDGVCEVLTELAQERCVVVITHSKALIEKMRGARRLRVAQGAVEELV